MAKETMIEGLEALMVLVEEKPFRPYKLTQVPALKREVLPPSRLKAVRWCALLWAVGGVLWLV